MDGSSRDDFVMSVFELVRLALSRLGTSRLRAALTMLGVIIGVASVVALVSVGQGTTANITSRLSSLGTNLLTINPGAQRTGNTFGAAGSSQTLTLDDANAIRALPAIAAVAPELSTQALVASGTTNTTTTIVGTTPDYLTVRAFSVWQGAFLNDISVDNRLRVAVLGATTASNLGLTAADVGSDVTIAGLPFRVIGILQAKGGAGFQNPDDQVIVPISTVQKYFSGGDAVRTIGVSVATAGQMDTANAEITGLLRERHALAADASDDFTIFDQAQLLETASSISATLTILLGGIASISLIVGGIGIMNIMLVSVRERTREIGIRKAIGARGRDILSQFLIEAMTLSLLGGVIGVVVGLGISALIARVAGWPFALDATTLIVATTFSAAVGIVFGVWPARQAAVLDPITALRYE
jgi:putative ABC transport system permease protein